MRQSVLMRLQYAAVHCRQSRVRGTENHCFSRVYAMVQAIG